jgi:hypothetical protein
MMSLGKRAVLKQLLTALGATLCIASFFAWDAMKSASMAQQPPSSQFSNRCDGQRVREDWLERHDAIRRARSALRDMIGAVHERYTDADFGYDPTTGKERRREFSDAFDAANKRFEDLINSAALNSTLACHVCQLSGIYDKAKEVGEGDNVTVQELVRLSDLFFAMASDQEQIEMRRHELQDMRDRSDRNGESADHLRDTIGTLGRDMEDYRRRLADFRHSPNYDPNSPKMAVEKDKYICDRMQP